MQQMSGRFFNSLPELFGQAYEAAYTLRLDEPAEIVNWKIEAAAPAPSLGAGYSLAASDRVNQAIEGDQIRLRASPGAHDRLAGV